MYVGILASLCNGNKMSQDRSLSTEVGENILGICTSFVCKSWSVLCFIWLDKQTSWHFSVTLLNHWNFEGVNIIIAEAIFLCSIFYNLEKHDNQTYLQTTRFRTGTWGCPYRLTKCFAICFLQILAYIPKWDSTQCTKLGY